MIKVYFMRTQRKIRWNRLFQDGRSKKRNCTQEKRSGTFLETPQSEHGASFTSDYVLIVTSIYIKNN